MNPPTPNPWQPCPPWQLGKPPETCGMLGTPCKSSPCTLRHPPLGDPALGGVEYDCWGFILSRKKGEGVSDLLARWNYITGKVMCSSCTITRWDKPSKRDKWWAVSCSGYPGLLQTVGQHRTSLFFPKQCPPSAGYCGWHRGWRL